MVSLQNNRKIDLNADHQNFYVFWTTKQQLQLYQIQVIRVICTHFI